MFWVVGLNLRQVKFGTILHYVFITGEVKRISQETWWPTEDAAKRMKNAQAEDEHKREAAAEEDKEDDEDKDLNVEDDDDLYNELEHEEL